MSDLVRHPLRMRRLVVRSISRPTPRVARIVLGGPDLDGFVSAAPDDHVKVFFPPASGGALVLPEVVAGGLRWPHEAPRPPARDYTPRRFDASRGELEIDMVLHGAGVGASWAANARPGDVVGVAGPRGSHLVPAGVDQWFFAADETGLPAVARWLRELPAGATASVVVLVDSPEERQPLPSDAAVSLTWVASGGGSDTLPLATAVRALRPPAAARSGAFLAWAGAESAEVAALRSLWCDEWQVPVACVRARGYWRRGQADHQEPHED